MKWIKALFTDKTGTFVLVQKPNVSIVLWVCAGIVTQLTDGRVHALASLIAFGSLFTWAYLEITRGVTIFRRVLGGVVIIIAIISRT